MSGWPRAVAALSVLLGAGSVTLVAALLAATAASPAASSGTVEVRTIRVDPPPPPVPVRTVSARREPAAGRPAASAPAPRALPAVAAPALELAPPLAHAPRVAIPPPAFAPGGIGPRIARPRPPQIEDGGGAQQAREPGANGSGDAGAELVTALDLERHYPRAARRAGIGGTSNVRLTLSDTGAVTAVEVVSSNPEGMFDEAARAACRNLRFRPATRAGAALPSTVDLEIAWTIR